VGTPWPGLSAAGGTPPPIDEVRHLLHGIPERSNALGHATAPVTLQVFADLECPICREFALGAQSRLIRNDVRTRRLRIEYLSMETATPELGPFVRQQVAALAAGRQDRMWYFVELFYREQGQEDSGYATNAYLQGIARQVPGLNLRAWEAARWDPLLIARVSDDEQTASELGLPGTPAFLIGCTGGRLRRFFPGSGSFEEPAPYEAAIHRLLRGCRRSPSSPHRARTGR
jgi:protein-disulfide isomerase